MSGAPGTNVSVSTAPVSSSNPAPTGQWFIVGACERGAVGTPIEIQSMADYATKLGARVSYGFLYDALDVFFREGGNTAWVSRVVGPAAVVAAHTLLDRAGSPLATLSVKAKGAGVAGNNISVAVSNGPVSNTFVLQISYNGVVVETSTVCGAPADAVAWAANVSNYVTITDSGSTTPAPNNNPAVISATALTSGADDNGSVTDTIRVTALAAFTQMYGPGQVSVPGSTTVAVHDGLLNHALSVGHRVALCDAPDTGTAATITALAVSDQTGATDPSYGTLLAPWVSYPPVPTGTALVPAPRSVPPSALCAGLMARNDGVNDANVPAAGANGISTSAIGVSQTYIDSDRALLDAAGVCVVRNILGQGGVQLYGYTSLAVDPNWTDLASVRFRMQLVNDALTIGAAFNFAQIDPQGKVLAAFNGALMANLSGYYAKGSLYGATPAQAFSVNTGPTVNTPVTVAARQINAVESVRMSPSADQVNILIIRYPVTQPLAA
jgi:hypothetical protein